MPEQSTCTPCQICLCLVPISFCALRLQNVFAGTLDSTGGHGRDVSAEGISSSGMCGRKQLKLLVTVWTKPNLLPCCCVVDLVKLRGKVKVLKKGDSETGDTKSISLYRSGDDPPSLKNKDGHLAGRLYLKNVNIMVPADTAMVEVHTWLLTMHAFELCCLLNYTLVLIMLLLKVHDFARSWLQRERSDRHSYPRRTATGSQRSCLRLTQS